MGGRRQGVTRGASVEKDVGAGWQGGCTSAGKSESMPVQHACSKAGGQGTRRSMAVVKTGHRMAA